MWEYFKDLAPAEVWAWIGAAALAITGPWIGYRLGRRAEGASEQREILRQLLDAISEASVLPGWPISDDKAAFMAWFDRRTNVFIRILNLVGQVKDTKLRTRLDRLQLIGEKANFYQIPSMVRVLGMPEERIRSHLLDDALQVVTMALRGEHPPPVPTKVDEIGFAFRVHEEEWSDIKEELLTSISRGAALLNALNGSEEPGNPKDAITARIQASLEPFRISQ